MKKLSVILLTAVLTAACNTSPQYDATGFFEATTVTVSAETAGRITALHVEEGDTLTAGRTVGAIDTTQLVLHRKQLQSQMAALEKSRPDIAKQVEALRQQIAHQRSECTRLTNLKHDGAATQKQVDDAKARLRILNGELAASLSTLGKNAATISDNALSIHYQIEQTNDRIAKSRITVPISGTVLAKYAETDEYASPGLKLFKMADLHAVYLRAYFTSDRMAHLRLGQQVTVVADFGGEEQHEYAGRIVWMADESEFTPKSIQTNDTRADLVYAVKIAVKNDGRLKLGLFGGVHL